MGAAGIYRRDLQEGGIPQVEQESLRGPAYPALPD
jgi:hypothetical protein